MLTSKLPKVGTTIFTQMSALANEFEALNLSQGFPDFGAPEALIEALAKATRDGLNQYPPMAGVPALREAVSEQIAHYRAVSVDPDTEITIVPGATESIFCAVTAVVRPGDEVILLDPVYDSYEPAIELAGGKAIHVPLTPDTFQPDWDAIEAAISPRTRMIMINSPHNPCGSVFSDSDMRTLERLVEAHDLLVSSDEVYEFLTFDGLEHRSVLQYPALRARSFAHFSFGKTFSVTGWKTGYCVAPQSLTAEFRKVHQFVTFVGVTPIQYALADFMLNHPAYQGSLAGFYQRKRDLFCDALQSSRFTLTPTQGSFFQIVDYSAITDEVDQALCRQWTREIGVASIPLSEFYQSPPKQQKLRFCFAKSDEVLLQAAEKLCAI